MLSALLGHLIFAHLRVDISTFHKVSSWNTKTWYQFMLDYKLSIYRDHIEHDIAHRTAITLVRLWPDFGLTSKLCCVFRESKNRPLARYVKLRVAHAPGMPGTFSPPPLVSDPDMHHGTCVTHVPWCMPGSLTSGFLWCRCRGKRSRNSRRMRNPQFCVSGKRPMMTAIYRAWTVSYKIRTRLCCILLCKGYIASPCG